MTAREGQEWYDPGRGTQAGRDLDDVLRQALHTVADAIEPADDGLTRIMRRLTMPSAVRQVALLVTDCIDLAQLIAIWLFECSQFQSIHQFHALDVRGPHHRDPLSEFGLLLADEHLPQW